jgi:glycogen(starch) synthase
MSKTICMFATNLITNDPRVRRQAAIFASAGYHVVVIGTQDLETVQEERLDGFLVIRLPYPRLWPLSVRQVLLRLLKAITPQLYATLESKYGRGHAGSQDAGQLEQPRWPQVEGGARRRGLAEEFRKTWTDLWGIRWIFWLNVAMARAAGALKPDICHANDLDTLLAGYLVKRRTGGKLTYDFHELYTEQYQEGTRSKLWHLYYSSLERWLIKRCDLKMTVCDSLGSWVSRQYGVEGVVTIINVPPYSTGRSVRHRAGQEKVILYHGLYMPHRGLEQLVKSSRYLESARIVLRGYGSLEQHLRDLVKEERLEDRVSFEPPVSMTDLITKACEADIGVAPFIPVCLNTLFCLPNKLFEYMMAGLAVVGSDLPEMRKIILEGGIGAVFEPGDPLKIAQAINELVADENKLERAKHNARHLAETRFNLEIEGRKLLRCYASTFGLPLARDGALVSDFHRSKLA